MGTITNEQNSIKKKLQENIEKVQNEINELRREKERLEVNYEILKKTYTDLVDYNDQLLVKYRGMTARYNILTNTISYKITQEVRAAFKPLTIKTLLLPFKIIRIIYDRYVRNRPFQRLWFQPSKFAKRTSANDLFFENENQEKSFLDALDEFIEKVNGQPEKPVVIISSTTKRIGRVRRLNRPMAFTQELAKMDIPIMYVYYRWKPTDDYDSDYDGGPLLQIPNDLFHNEASNIAQKILSTRKIFLISIPDVNSVSELSLFKLFNWNVGYEVRDDWSEFSNAGIGKWYSATFEIFLCTNADLVTVVSNRLRDKMIDFGAIKENTRLIPNGLNTDFFEKTRKIFASRKNGYRGKGVIGYFGHLTEKWFNWELLLETANQHREMQFEIIGFDAPINLVLPANIKLLGEKSHEEIIEITENWSLAIIPFRNNDLAKAVDPIKLYEYLALGLPCVSCEMDQINGYPFTFIYTRDEQFAGTLKMVLSYQPQKSDWDEMEKFIQTATWKFRVIDTLKAFSINN
ncbi:MAG: glycosyltransferase family protein [Bellilinea sp.]